MPFETINDVDIYYEIHGPSGAPPLVCIEGWGYSLWMWFRQIPDLKEKCRCIVFDNRGVGKSSKPDYPYTMDLFAGDTVGLMERLGIKRAHFFGISMGGYIAQQIAVSHPERVKSLILASTSFGGPNAVIAEKRVQAMMFAIPTETLSVEQAMEMRHSVTYSPQFLKDNKPLLKQIQRWREQNPQPLYARGNQAAATVEFNVEEELGQVSVPTLIVHGTNDLIVPPQNAEMLADKISTSRLVLIEGGPHLTFIEYYEKFNNAVLSFVNEVERESFTPEPKRTVI